MAKNTAIMAKCILVAANVVWWSSILAGGSPTSLLGRAAGNLLYDSVTALPQRGHDAGSSLRLDNGLGQTPPMGWNSWNHFGCEIDEDIVKATAEALVSTGLAELGYQYVNIDDCWAELQRDSEGNLVSRVATFSQGIEALADHVHSLGLKLGIYSDAGEYTCQKQPGSFGYEERDAMVFASWVPSHEGCPKQNWAANFFLNL